MNIVIIEPHPVCQVLGETNEGEKSKMDNRQNKKGYMGDGKMGRLWRQDAGHC